MPRNKSGQEEREKNEMETSCTTKAGDKEDKDEYLKGRSKGEEKMNSRLKEYDSREKNNSGNEK